ncbi:MAG: glycosyltransferase [Cyanobium sp.]
MRTDLYIFQWISDMGGADTRLKELLILLKDHFRITCIPNDAFRLQEKENTDYLDALGVAYCMPEALPQRIEGFAYANCNFRLFSERERIDFIKDKGLTFLWSNDMMWHTDEELEAIEQGKVDCCLFTSPFHRNALIDAVLDAREDQRTAILENYFDGTNWPFVERIERPFTVFGKVSRDDWLKFSKKFPLFYEEVTQGLEARYRIMGWGEEQEKTYSWFNFTDRWEFLRPGEILTQEFLWSIDVFLYNCHREFVENQSRAIVEAQLMGLPVVAPNKWNFPNMIWSERTGFLWDNREEAHEACLRLTDYETRRKMGKLASECARDIWCNADEARRNWMAVLNYAVGSGN